MVRKKILTAAVAVSVGFALATPATAADKTIVVSGSGGGLAKIMDKVFDKPFTEKTGIKIRRIGTTNRASLLKSQEATGRVLWDATELSGPEYPQSAKRGYLMPLDYGKIDPDGKLPAIAKAKYGVAIATFATVMAVRTDKLPAGKKMTSWADFWDVKTFPGPRTLRNNPTGNLEYALLADGVKREDLYKVLATKDGLDRAFKKLDAIKKHITVWWKAGAQPIQLLSDGEVFFGTAFNGRVSTLAKSGKPVVIVWNGGALAIAYYSIPKGAKNPNEAMEFLKFMATNPDRMAAFAKIIPYPGFAPGLYDKLPPALGKQMPTYPANVSVMFKVDTAFWVENMEKIKERWDAWLLR